MSGLALLCCFIFLVVTSTEGSPTCAYCLDVYDPVRDPACKNEGLACSPNEQCYAERYLDTNGVQKYSFHCKPNQYCEVLKRLVGRRETRDAQVKVCQVCCDGFMCNKHLCQ